METETVQPLRSRLERFTFLVGADGMTVHEEECADMNAPEFCANYKIDARDMMAAIAIDTQQNAAERPSYTIHVCSPKRSRALRLVSRLRLPKSITTLKLGSIKVEV